MLTLASESVSLSFLAEELTPVEVEVGVGALLPELPDFLGPASPRLPSVDFAAALGFSHGFFFGTASSTGCAVLEPVTAPGPHFGVGFGAGAGAGSSFFAAGPHRGFVLGVGSGVGSAWGRGT